MPHYEEDDAVAEAGGGNFGWFLAGAIIGAAVGVLYAPKSGKDTRQFISQKTQEGREAVAETSRDVFERTRDIYARGRQLVEDAVQLFERGRNLVRG